MTATLISLIVIFFVLVLVEFCWRNKILKPELARKLVHIGVGIVVATWMFYIPRFGIISLGLLMLAVVSVSKYVNFFSAIHSVKRKTYGEIYFALGIVASALLTDSPWIFAAAILHVSLADGLAGIVGCGVKKPMRYVVFRHFKSLQGTLTFFVISISIFAVAIYFDPVHIPNIALSIIVIFSLLIALIENISPYGSDDLIVPVITVLLIQSTNFI